MYIIQFIPVAVDASSTSCRSQTNNIIALEAIVTIK
jgi:hypothetical protein